jgi:hypothetical protein
VYTVDVIKAPYALNAEPCITEMQKYDVGDVGPQYL